MPEGHTIHRAARRIASVLAGKQLEIVEARNAQLRQARTNERLHGATVTSVEPRGKHLLIHTDRELSIHSHLRMDGVWHLYRDGEPWKRPRRRAWLVLGAQGWNAVNFDGPLLTLHHTADLLRSPMLTSLGPDVLAEEFDEDEYLRRMRAAGTVHIGEALLQQQLVSGIGNIYRAETLYLGGITPWRLVRDCSDDELRSLRRIATSIMRDGVLDARAITYAGPGARGQWIYGRAGRACRRCGGAVSAERMGPNQRTAYWCSTCQR